jgi:hypothetical protein
MVDKRRCGRCHNEIPEWANGVCYVCKRIEDEHARFTGAMYIHTRKTVQIDSPRLRAFNLFLSDVYGKEICFSDILTQTGLATAKINKWKRNRDFLNCFLELFEKQLVSELVKLAPNHNPRIPSRWFLDNWTIQQMITEFEITEIELRYVLAFFIDLLRSQNGQDVLENAIVKAARLAAKTVDP